jgi:outer membrane lipoprotein-sorting protein
MRKIIYITLAAALILSVNPASAEDWAGLMGKIKAKYADFSKEITDMTIVQETATTAPNGNVSGKTKLFRKDKKFRMETSMHVPDAPQDMQTTVICDGKDTWMISPFMGKTKVPAKDAGQSSSSQNWWDIIPENAKITGMENVSGKNCYVVEFTSGEKMPYTKMWIDENSLTMVKAETAGGSTAWVLSDFKKIKGGWETGYKIETFMNGKLASTATITSLETNTGLSDDLFNADKVEGKSVDLENMIGEVNKRKNM